MRSSWTKIFLALPFFPLLATPSVFAAEYYPKAISLRAFGTDQGNVGDCQSAAEVGALESAFAGQGFGFVQLSLFYRHAANWVDQAPNEVTRLDLDAADKDFIHRAGPLLPDYMWPEDSHGYDPASTGNRPHPAQAVVWDPEFPSAAEMGFHKEFFPFGGVVSLNSLKGAVAAGWATGNAVVLSVHGDLFQPNQSTQWDHVDGLLSTPYSWATLMADLEKKHLDAKTGINHALMVVGFDDSLYAGLYPTPGALIVRNSWNDASEVDFALANPTPEEKAALPSMRLKVFSRNLPGFYALPYQYILDMQANNVGGYEELSLNYKAFAEKYVALSSRYHVQTLPYVCDAPLRGTFRLADGARRDVAKFGTAFKTLNDPSLPADARTAASEVTYKMALREMQGRQKYVFGNDPAFQYARLSSHDGLHIDRADEFYAGKFQSYYCPNAPSMWPASPHLTVPGFRESIRALGEGGGSLLNWFQFLRALSAASF